MNTNTTTIAGAFERETWGVEYIRPSNSSLRAAGGVLVSSSNDGAGNGSWSHSPTDLWEFPDGSQLEVAFSGCGEFRKRRIVIANAFSLNMLTLGVGATDLQVCRVPPEYIRGEIEEAGDFTSIVGHADTSAVFSSQLGLDIPCNRATFKLEEDHILFVGQYKGPRLPEGATSLPEGAKVEWAMVTIA